PATDSTIQHNYDVDTIDQKVKNKTYLQEKVGLPVDEEVILIGMVSRLTEQKGFRLVEIIMDALTNRRVQIILLGTGEKSIEDSFKYFDWAYDGQVRAIIDFDVKLAQEIYAGADLFLMPSAFEPCGLSQMISMRYGTLPLVHEIGGLKDTVAPYNKYDITGTGFSFNHFDWWVLLNTLDDAIGVYYNHYDNWQTIQKQAMQTDFSWQQSTQKYINLYQSIAY
ncbi:starch synthase, partial [Dolosigranulum pigrum]